MRHGLCRRRWLQLLRVQVRNICIRILALFSLRSYWFYWMRPGTTRICAELGLKDHACHHQMALKYRFTWMLDQGTSWIFLLGFRSNWPNTAAQVETRINAAWFLWKFCEEKYIWPFLEWADFEPWSDCPVSCGDQTATRVSALWRR